jgi:hypothetical protein
MSFGRLKMRLWWSRWNDFWRCGNNMQTHFLHSGHPKKWLGRSHGSDVSIRQKALRTHNFLLDVLKCVFVEFDEAMLQGVERPCELIFYLLGIQKSLMDEVPEVMFQVGELPWELIICLLDVLIFDFVDVDVAIFHGFQIPCELFF